MDWPVLYTGHEDKERNKLLGGLPLCLLSSVLGSPNREAPGDLRGLQEPSAK